MNKSTPGPWRVCTSNGGWTNVCPVNHPNLPICNLVENNEANALLIAAAPELYELAANLYENACLFNHASDPCWIALREQFETVTTKIRGETSA